MIPRPPVTGLLLAGGQGARMDSADKGLLMLGDRTIADRVAARLRSQVDTMIVSANRHQDAYRAFGPVYGDDARWGTYAGPLAGLAAGLTACATPWLAATPCDAPYIPLDMVDRLLAAAVATDRPGAFAVADGRRQAACMVLKRDLLPALVAFLDAGDRKVGIWQNAIGMIAVPFDEPEAAQAFANINTPDDLTAARTAVEGTAAFPTTARP